jgi:predicted regulator of Ras-like GTPase activity (Roadblock/LC7/MglB family)
VVVGFDVILPLVPQPLLGKKTPGPAAKFVLPTPRVLEQLKTGAVKVPFGELRKAAPQGVFIPSSTHDDQFISLPLRDVLRQVRPENFARGPQVVVQIPGDISDLFGSKGERLANVRVLSKEEATKTSFLRRQEIPAPSPAPSAGESPTTPPMRPQESPLAAPAASAPSAKLVPMPTAAPPPPSPTAFVVKPPPHQTPPATLPSPSVPAPKTLAIPLGRLATNWPEVIQQEIAAQKLSEVICEPPVAQVMQDLKQGAMRYPWRQIRDWLKAAAPLGPSPHAEQLLDIPLAAVAPHFLTQRPNGDPVRAEVSEAIAALFSKPGPAPAPRASPQPPLAAPAPTPAPVQPAPSAPAAPLTGTLPLPIASVSQAWPQPIREALARLNLGEATLEIPMELATQGLKNGRLEFSWQEVGAWMKPSFDPSQTAALGATRVELPLNVVAPAYLKLRPFQQSRRVLTSSEIPDVFTRGEPPPASAAGPASATADLALATSAETPAGAPESAASKPAPTDLAQLFGEPEKRHWTPNEIVKKTAQLPGLAGALIALQDGLLVASSIPSALHPETIAAFLPQMFGRMNQYTRELKMGELHSVAVAVDQATLVLFPAGIIYFAAITHPGKAAPMDGLKLIARELRRHTR